MRKNRIRLLGLLAMMAMLLPAKTAAAVITFPFNLGTEGQTATFSDDVAPYFKTSYVEHGDNLILKDANSGQTRFQPVISNEGSANDGNRIDFMVIPVAGLKFLPTNVKFKTTRFGTDGGKVDVKWINSDGTTSTIATGVIPARNNATPNVTEFDEPVDNAKACDGLCGLRLNLYSLGNTKQVGFSDIVIEGELTGTTQDVAHYTLTVKLDPEEAGKLTVTPNITEFDEGDEVTVSVQENFGYHFAAWVDADGQTVSTDNPYSFSITANTDLTATFTKKNTYALSIALTEGARDNLVQVQPEGTMIDGRRMYEEGQDVKLTALSNKVLTFIGWEDNSTNAERIIRMDADQSLTANFSADDYIVGWDFYYDQPAKERAADYKSDSENAGLLSLHNEKGETSGWLTRGIGNGQENGRYAARIWKVRTQGLYFEASFSTKGYKNIKVTSSLGCSYNTYSVNNLQYSVDGVNYTTVATFNITGSGWFDKEDVALGSDADEQNRVYVRWMPDRESALVGNSTDYDGLAISDIFITADAGSLAEEEAVLMSSNPEQGATGVSANGSIILSFDKKIKAGQGVATLTMLDGSAVEELQPVISGKSAIFKYSGLEYATDYTFQMPAGVLTSRSGNPVAAAAISFTTMERTQPAPRLYDAVVDAEGIAPAGYDGAVYTTVQAAVDAAPAGRALPWLIFIKNGDYKEHVDIPANKPYIHLIGQSRDGVVIKDDRLSGGDNAVHVSVGATVVVNADNTFIENLTMENIWGHEKQAGPQALALNTGGDRIAMNKVRLLSYQDTWITTSTSNNRHYIKNSLIEGAVDFIYNSGNVYLDGDTLEINRPSGGFIVAPSHGADVKWGNVFMNNVLRPIKGMNVTDIWLGRPWHNQPKTVFINLQTYINIPAAGWYETMGGLPALWADYNTVDAQGNPVDLSQRRDTYYYTDGDGNRVYGTAKNYLTPEEAAEYTLKNVMGGSDNWQPDLMTEACEAPIVAQEDGKLTWDAVPYAICYVVTKNGQVVGFTTETEFDCSMFNDQSSIFTVQAVNEFGGLSLPGSSNDADAIVSIQAAAMPEAVYTLDGKRAGQASRGFVIIRHDDGTASKRLR
ncbi:MAG: Ig-like domain-containing protein [Prevotella sp.]|nr:Ig-like domain-containing protein [Prevotella sp.]